MGGAGWARPRGTRAYGPSWLGSIGTRRVRMRRGGNGSRHPAPPIQPSVPFGPRVTSERSFGRWRLWPRRTLWPARDGWWCLGAALGLGFAAINTGNNLLYLLVSMLLGLIIVSGVLSEQSIRRVRVEPVLPDELFAGRLALFGARVVNRKRWWPSYSISVEVLGVGQRAYLAKLPAGGERLITWPETPPARGRRRLAGFRVATRFPFGLFVKAGQLEPDVEVVVYPAVGPVSPDRHRELDGAGGGAAPRRGRGHGLHNLREYRFGDDPRLIHWRSSAKSPSLMVRELEADSALDTRLVLEGTGASDSARLERALAEAASLAVHLLGGGASVDLVGPGVHVPLGSGPAQRARILTALALYEPTASPLPVGAGPPPSDARLREIRVALGSA